MHEVIEKSASCPRARTEWARLLRRQEARRSRNAQLLAQVASFSNLKRLSANDQRTAVGFDLEQWENEVFLLTAWCGPVPASHHVRSSAILLARLAKACSAGMLNALGAFSSNNAIVVDEGGRGAVHCLLRIIKRSPDTIWTFKSCLHGLAEALGAGFSGPTLLGAVSSLLAQVAKVSSPASQTCDASTDFELYDLALAFFSNKALLSAMLSQSSRELSESASSSGQMAKIDPQGFLGTLRSLISASALLPILSAEALGHLLDHAQRSNISSLDVSRHFLHGEIIDRPLADSAERLFSICRTERRFAQFPPPAVGTGGQFDALARQAQTLFATTLHERGFRLATQQSAHCSFDEASVFRSTLLRLAERDEIAASSAYEDPKPSTRVRL